MTPWPKPDPEGLIMSDCTDVRSLSSHIPGDRKETVGAPGWGQGGGGMFNEDRVSVGEDEKVLEMIVEMVVQHCEGS